MPLFLFRKDGSVTVFCALIMTTLIFFFMVIVDFARILLFHRLTESAAMMSIQSVLSAYDEALYREYGLFGRGGSDKDRLFREALSYNHDTNVNLFSLSSHMDLTSLEFQNANVTNDQFLGEHPIFERQIVEEMKYKAPVLFTVEVMEIWGKLTDGVSQADSMMATMNKLEDLFIEREQLLEEAINLQNDLGKKLKGSSYYQKVYSKLSNSVNGYGSYVQWINYENNILQQLQNENLTEEEIEELQDKLGKYSSQISSYLHNFNLSVKDVILLEDKLQSEHQEAADTIIGKINASSALNNTISIQYELYMKNDGGSARSDTNDEISRQLSNMTFDDEGLVRDNIFFVNYKSAIQDQQLHLVQFLGEVNTLVGSLSSAINQVNVSGSASSNMQKQLNDQHTTSKNLYQQYQANYDDPGSIKQYWKDQVSSTKSIQNQLKQEEQAFQEEVKGLKSLLDTITDKEALEQYREPYKQLKEKAARNLQLNEQLENDETYVKQEESDSGRIRAEESSTQLMSVLSQLTDIATSAWDRVYVNEYIISRYNHFPLGDKDENERDIDASLLHYNQQEVEYILYGIAEPMENVMLAYGEIFAFRFAIRTIEGLIENRALANPLLVFSAAVLYGVKAAMQDMISLQSKGSTELSKYIKVQIDYENYLRLFLLLHGFGQEQRFARMIAIIEQNHQLNLMKVATAITGNVTSTTTLWTLPGIASAVGAIIPMQNRIKGNLYEKMDTFTVSY